MRIEKASLRIQFRPLASTRTEWSSTIREGPLPVGLTLSAFCGSDLQSTIRVESQKDLNAGN